MGCGPGGAALLAARQGAQVAGLDASPESVAVARERVPEGDFRVGDMENLPWPNGSFNAVTGLNSFPFAGDPAAALADSRRVLARGGKLGMVVFSPPGDSQQTRIMAAISALAPLPLPGAPGPFALSAAGVVESRLEAAGLRVVERGEFAVALSFRTAEAACRAFMAGGVGANAIHCSGEERVREAIRKALEGFELGTGDYRIQNRFHFAIAE